MNNKYRITIKDTPDQTTSKTHVETPRMRRSTCVSEMKSGLKESALSNNKTMNNDYRTTIMHVETPRRSTCPLKIISGLMESALRNNYFIETRVDIAAITETWLSSTDKHRKTIGDITLPGFDFVHVPRSQRSGGGDRSSLLKDNQKRSCYFP